MRSPLPEGERTNRMERFLWQAFIATKIRAAARKRNETPGVPRGEVVRRTSQSEYAQASRKRQSQIRISATAEQ